MASNHVCIFCKEKEHGLKLFVPDRWETAKNAAACRLTLHNDYFSSTSEEMNSQKENIITQIVLVNSVLLKDNFLAIINFLNHPGK